MMMMGLEKTLVGFASNLMIFMGITCSVVAQQNPVTYLTGGDVPLSAQLQQELDTRAQHIRLGFNTRFQLNAGISPESMAKIVVEVCDQLPKQNLPGMLIYVDSFEQQNIPIGIGNRMVTPEIHQLEWSTYFDLGSLTAPLLTMPFLVSALEQNPQLLQEEIFSDELEFSDSMPTYAELLTHQLNWADRDAMIHGRGLHFSESSLPLMQVSLPEAPSRWSSVQDFELVADSLTLEYQAPIKTLFFEQIALPLGMMNSITDQVPETWRIDVAPGGLTPFYGRYAWGEASSPSAFLQKSNSVRGGFFTTADDLGTYARFWMNAYHLGSEDGFSTETLLMTLEPKQMKEEALYGTGWQLGEFGKKSFGWTGVDGRAFWVDPEANMFCIILVNSEHPAGVRDDLAEFTRSLVGRLHQTLLFYKPIACSPFKKNPRSMASLLDPTAFGG